jgi:Carboxypeptidase regulatory-like domain/TonB dependent receptor
MFASCRLLRAGTRIFAVLLVTLLTCCFVALGQQVTGSITGSVLDSTGGSLVGASVTLTNTGTGAAQTARTDSSGNFQFLLLNPGNYVLETTNPGFKTVRRDGILVEADRSLAVPVILTVGNVTETVEVAAGAVLLEANTSSLGTVMDSRKIEDLPLNFRNPLGLANLIPTVRGIGTFGGQILESWRSAAIDIGGGPSLSNGFMIDGLPNDKIGDAAGNLTFLAIDATQEFKVLTNSMSAEFGRTGGGIVSVISKSGTNKFHGGVFEYFRNTVLTANDFFANRSGAARPALHFNQFGGFVGGPIKKDKLFFFFNDEQYKEVQGFVRLNTAPTALQRIGNFSQTNAANGLPIIIYDPLTTVVNNGVITRTPFQNNTIPANRISAVAKDIFALYPAANVAGNPVTGINNLVQSGTQPTDRYNIGIRGDYLISASQRIALRYTKDTVSWTFPNFYHNVLENEGRFISVPRNSASLLYTNALSPTLLLDIKIGYNRDAEHGYGPYSQSYGKGLSQTSLGFPSTYVNSWQKGRFTPNGALPRFNITDLVNAAGYTNLLSGSGDQERGGGVWAIDPSITKVFGAHTLRTGYQFTFYTYNYGGVGMPLLYFDRGFTQNSGPSANAGDGIASFLLGDISNNGLSVTPYQPDLSLGQHYQAVFLQDDWKVSRKLTLNLGLRWERESPMTDRYNIFTNFNLTAPSPLKVAGLNLAGAPFYPAATSGGSRGMTDADNKHFGPRTGFAYQATDKLVVRGGFGMSYIPTKGIPIPSWTGFRVTNPVVASINGGSTPFNTLPNPYPNGISFPTGSSLGASTGLGSDMQAILRNVSPGYSMQWNTTIQYQPKGDWLVETAYIGSRGVHLLTSQAQNLDQLNPQYLSLGSQLTQAVANPFSGTFTVGPLSNATVTRAQLLLPYPQYTSVSNGWAFLGDSIYHALAVKVEKRFSRDYSLLLSYTFSHIIDSAAGTAGAVRTGADPNSPVLNWYNLAAERSTGIDDIPHRVVLTGLWELPYFKNSKGPLNWTLAGWHLNSILTVSSGQPITVISNSVPTTNVTGGGQNRPNVVPGCDVGNVSGGQSLAAWFNTACYTRPANFTFGNSSRTIPGFRSDRLFNLDFSVFKDFRFKERYNLQFRGEAFNLTNTTTFAAPGNDVTSTSFGVVSSAFSTPRQLQFSLRLTF